MTNSNPPHCHCKESLLFTRKWEDIAALWCEQLITLMKYREACKLQELSIINNSTMHDYITTRIENIERCYSCLYINGKIDAKQFGFYEGTQDIMLATLYQKQPPVLPNQIWDDTLENVGIWSSFKLFDWYINAFLNSDFFKENDIRIE